jgi:hypothetical protein
MKWESAEILKMCCTVGVNVNTPAGGFSSTFWTKIQDGHRVALLLVGWASGARDMQVEGARLFPIAQQGQSSKFQIFGVG